MMTGCIKIEHVRRMNTVRGVNIIAIDDVDCITLHRQSPNENGVYKPEVVVIICNSDSLYIGIFVALGEDGKYYTDCDLEWPTGGNSGYPSKSGRKSKTLSQALRVELERLKKYRFSQNGNPNKRICNIADTALRVIDAKCLRQMTIFDILETETI